MTNIERAKKLIEQYCAREFDDATVDFSRLDRIPLAFTCSEDEEHAIQVYANLRDCRLETYVDGELAEVEEHTMDEMLESVLPYLEFDALVAIDCSSVGDLIADATERSNAGEAVPGTQMDGKEAEL